MTQTTNKRNINEDQVNVCFMFHFIQMHIDFEKECII